MARLTIDFGIDLGTTNSAVAVLNGTRTEVIKNNDESDCTPSAVWIDKKDKLYVGREAKQHLFDDSENAAAEFKLQMGKSQAIPFKRSGRGMKPEELSAEILKSLRASVKQRTGEAIDAVVVTVPADFDLPQAAATTSAAQLAGFSQCPLLQEPVAAAMAYGFQTLSEKAFWFVFDFGGGTFDAAIIQVKEGQIEVVNHGGDKQLGGKLIDWAIVDDLICPAVAKEHGLADFRRGNPKWKVALAKLKHATEEAKMRLSTADSTGISIEYLCPNEHGEAIAFDYELTRAQTDPIIEAFYERAVNISRRVLAEKHLAPEMVEKILLVGGPTFTPLFRERLADKKRGLGIPLDFSVDPMTVVARGAAIFAGTQRLERKAQAAVQGSATLEIVYEPIVKEQEPSVGGKVVLGGGASPAGFTIEFINREAKPPWSSGKVSVNAQGAFMATLWADEGLRNAFAIEVRDSSGTLIPSTPDRIEITLGNKPGAAPLTHSIGVAQGNNKTAVIIEKGTALPARKRDIHKTIQDLRRGASGQLLRLPVVEGESPQADHNRLIGFLDISSGAIPRDIPAQSDVEITLEVDASRNVRARAYIPHIEKEFEQIFKMEMKEVGADELRRAVDAVKKRLREVKTRLNGLPGEDAGRKKAEQILARIETERMEQDVDAAFAASGNDPDASDKCASRVLDMQLALDELERSLEWPSLLRKAEDELAEMARVVEKMGRRRADRETAEVLERETRAAIGSNDASLLRQKIQDLVSFEITLERERPEFWTGALQWLEGRRDSMTDPRKADELFAQARRAADKGDLPGLQGAVSQLYQFLPKEQLAASPFGGGTIR